MIAVLPLKPHELNPNLPFAGAVEFAEIDALPAAEHRFFSRPTEGHTGLAASWLRTLPRRRLARQPLQNSLAN